MPIDIDLSRLDEGGGLESTFLRCKAHWHKSCYDQFNSTKFKRAEKDVHWKMSIQLAGSIHTHIQLFPIIRQQQSVLYVMKVVFKIALFTMRRLFV